MARQGYLLSFEAEPHLPLILKDNYQTKKRKKEQENKKEKKNNCTRLARLSSMYTPHIPS